MDFNSNIFINCPFDNDYFPILRSILFCITYLGYSSKISETSDSGANRLNGIKKLITDSKFSIHDISRVELNRKNLPRFNMPLECGIDFGAKLIGEEKLKSKIFLILEKEKFRYQEFMSDIAGNDIRAHSNDPEQVIKHIRDWLKLNSKKKLVFANKIWLEYNEFLFDYIEYAKQNNFDPHDIYSITFSDLIELIKEWLKGRQERPSKA